jgi:four helix bundle protein
VHYRELVVWQKAMGVARGVYALAPKLPREETFGVRAQMTRAAVSVATNIAEGWARESSKEKAQFLSIAQGSLAEVDTLLTLAEQLGWFNTSELEPLRTTMDEVGKMLTTMRRQHR